MSKSRKAEIPTARLILSTDE